MWAPSCRLLCGRLSSAREPCTTHTYLAGETPWSWRWFTQGEAQPLHFGCADPCEFLKCGNLDCIICGSGGLRSRSPLKLLWKIKTAIFYTSRICPLTALSYIYNAGLSWLEHIKWCCSTATEYLIFTRVPKLTTLSCCCLEWLRLVFFHPRLIF